MQIIGIEAGKSRPALFVDPQDGWPKLIVHRSNILVVQTVGGSASVVYVLSFYGDKAQKLFSATTRGTARVQFDDWRSKMIIDVPPYASETPHHLEIDIGR